MLCCLAFLLLSYLSCETIGRMASSFTDSSSPVVWLDPGHGGEDGGTQSADGLLEKDVNLSIALTLRDLLESAGYRVKMPREEDVSIGDNTLATVRERKVSDIHSRLSLVEEERSCVLISIHQNYFEQSRYSGAQMFYSPNNEESGALAESIRQSVVSLLQPENTRQNKEATDSIYLLWNTQAPAVLVECGFLSNAEEAALLGQEAYRAQMAFCIYDGLTRWLAENGASAG